MFNGINRLNTTDKQLLTQIINYENNREEQDEDYVQINIGLWDGARLQGLVESIPFIRNAIRPDCEEQNGVTTRKRARNYKVEEGKFNPNPITCYWQFFKGRCPFNKDHAVFQSTQIPKSTHSHLVVPHYAECPNYQDLLNTTNVAKANEIWLPFIENANNGFKVCTSCLIAVNRKTYSAHMKKYHTNKNAIEQESIFRRGPRPELLKILKNELDVCEEGKTDALEEIKLKFPIKTCNTTTVYVYVRVSDWLKFIEETNKTLSPLISKYTGSGPRGRGVEHMRLVPFGSVGKDNKYSKLFKDLCCEKAIVLIFVGQGLSSEAAKIVEGCVVDSIGFATTYNEIGVIIDDILARRHFESLSIPQRCQVVHKLFSKYCPIKNNNYFVYNLNDFKNTWADRILQFDNTIGHSVLKKHFGDDPHQLIEKCLEFKIDEVLNNFSLENLEQ